MAQSLFDFETKPIIEKVYYDYKPSNSPESSIAILDDLKKLKPRKLRKKDSGEIYYIARRQKRILTGFPEGFASNWSFQLHGVFAKCLDIKHKPLTLKEKENGVKPYRNQGNLFCFSSGQMIYDSNKAYSMLWNDCINHIKVAVQIFASEQVKICSKTGIRDPGKVTGIFLINQNNRLNPIKRFSMTQDAFIKGLIIGFEEIKNYV